jgi:hypothetical protein
VICSSRHDNEERSGLLEKLEMLKNHHWKTTFVFDPHGQKVFTNGKGKEFLTKDSDTHFIGVWKIFDGSGRRKGVYKRDLTKIKD